MFAASERIRYLNAKPPPRRRNIDVQATWIASSLGLPLRSPAPSSDQGASEDLSFCQFPGRCLGYPLAANRGKNWMGTPHSHSIVAGTSKYLKADDIASGRANITVMLTVRKFRLDAIEVDRCRKGRGALAVMRSEFQCLTSRGWKVAIRGPVARHCAGAVAGNVTRLWDLL